MTTRLTPSLARFAGARALLIASLCTTQAQAATINVSVNGDNASQGIVSPSPNGADGLCSLIGAMINANADNQSGDTDCAAGSGADTLVLPTGAMFTLTTARHVDSDLGNTGLPIVTSPITINGNGSTFTRSSNAGDFRILRIESGGALTLNKVTVSGGKANADRGGGILSGPGTSLTVNQSTVSGNVAPFAGGIDSRGTLAISNSTISGNTGLETVGGIGVRGVSATISNSTITGNSASFGPGGLEVDSDLTLSNSIVSGNSAPTAGVAELAQNAPGLTTTGVNLFGHSGLTSDRAFSFSPGPNDRTATQGGTHPTALASILNTTLASNGGPTQTHALVANSPAVNASGTGATTTDQRGFVKAEGDTVRDIGAFELNGVDPNAVVAVNGTCGSASGSPSATAPTGAALCATGTATTVSGNDTAWTWGCNGSNGGTSTAATACSANYPKPSLTINANPLSIAIDGISTVTASSDNGLAPALSNSSTGVCTLGSSSGSVNVSASATGTAAGTCTIAANQPAVTTGTTRYQSADPKTVSITVNKKTQTITGLAASPGTIFVGGSSSVSATASSGLTVSFGTSPGSVCTNNGSTVTGVGAGTCTVTASQAGNDSFAAAPPVTATVTVNAVPVNGLCGSAKTTSPTATMPSGSTLCSAGVASPVTGSSGVWAWSCNGTNGGSSDTSCSAPYGTQSLSLSATPSSIRVGESASILASSSAGLTVSLATTSPACTLSGSTATGTNEGSCVVSASQPGTGDTGTTRYLAAASVNTTLTVNPAGPPPSACDRFTRGANVIDLRGSPGGQTVRGDAGRFNVIYGSGFADAITGGSAGNCIDGGNGNDRISGGSGENYLYGGNGNDTLTPGSGSTAMDGGAGTDKCGKTSSRATATYSNCESN